jgi:hypothetical protein
MWQALGRLSSKGDIWQRAILAHWVNYGLRGLDLRSRYEDGL